jgi:hypothetical protein
MLQGIGTSASLEAVLYLEQAFASVLLKLQFLDNVLKPLAQGMSVATSSLRAWYELPASELLHLSTERAYAVSAMLSVQLTVAHTCAVLIQSGMSTSEV